MFKFVFTILFINLSFWIKAQSFIDTFTTFTPLEKEIECMHYFSALKPVDDRFNTYILSKFSETMYPERLDYMFRFFQNDRKPVDSVPSTSWLKKHAIINDTNFEYAFKKRFEHMFDEGDHVRFKYIQAIKYINNPFKKADTYGFDPELMVISTDSYVIIAYRGTDMMENNVKGEWIGTDFNFLKAKNTTYFGGRIHRGFLHSFEIIEKQLSNYLNEIGAKDKPIWITGHSLGGSMATLTGIFLANEQYNVQGIYPFGSPNPLGNRKFVRSIDKQTLASIHRYEFSMDPVSIMTWIGYKSFGERNWISSDYHLYQKIPHRALRLYRIKGKKISKTQKKQLRFALKLNIFRTPYRFHHHNPQWIVKALVNHLPEGMENHCPDIDDSFPFIYYAWEKAL